MAIPATTQSEKLAQVLPHGIEVFFNKPTRPFPLERLTYDIETARFQLAVASAWFTDTAVAKAIIQSEAAKKFVFLNSTDVRRGARRAYEMLDQYFCANSSQCEKRLYILGSEDWQEGVMHHKFVLIDQLVVWIGSYNLTHQAKKNYETVLRINNAEVCARFWEEVEQLRDEQRLFLGRTQFASANGAFRCACCECLVPLSQMGVDGDSWAICQGCADRCGRWHSIAEQPCENKGATSKRRNRNE
jgi:phosphatidylserine/phosphatidylglycerophosphate/cardiolipin synthase-like enzyme